MSRKRVLFVVHNHPAFSPGGAEICALDLYTQMRDSGEFEPYLLARVGPGSGLRTWPHPGVRLCRVNDDPNQYLLYAAPDDFDLFTGGARSKDLVAGHYREFLQAIRPDVVHFQHTVHLGYDLIRQTRNTLPGVPIVYTLHEYLPICLNDGQMVRPGTLDLCVESSPALCRRCFPDRQAGDFFFRKQFIQSHLECVDLFLAPSRFLRDRFVQWGLAPERIRVEENGRRLVPASGAPAHSPGRNRLGYFGQFSMFKGLDVLLQALITPPEEGGVGSGTPPHLWLHGANLEHQPESYQREIRRLLREARGSATFIGRYDQADLPRLMQEIDWVVVPSIWWENSPLVIQEAFANRRPVICSDIGGMAEKVTDGVNGLHFRVRDPISLARTIQRAIGTEGLWDRLVANIPPVYDIVDASRTHCGIYRSLMASPAGAGLRVVGSAR